MYINRQQLARCGWYAIYGTARARGAGYRALAGLGRIL
jgi:hypothetical protein